MAPTNGAVKEAIPMPSVSFHLIFTTSRSISARVRKPIARFLRRTPSPRHQQLRFYIIRSAHKVPDYCAGPARSSFTFISAARATAQEACERRGVDLLGQRTCNGGERRVESGLCTVTRFTELLDDPP